jgi:hypothetical protein
MSNSKKYWFFLAGLLMLISGVAISCGQSGYTTYTNDVGGYSISYPINWQAEITQDSKIYVIKSPSHFASVRIDVIDAMSSQQAAQLWITAMGSGNQDFALLDNKPMEGFWNWYVSYDYDAGTGPYHGEAYFKSTPEHVYKLDTAGDKAEYDSYPFPTIISSFKLK